MEQERTIWARFGVSVTGLPLDIESLLNGSSSLEDLIIDGRLTINVDGESYVPAESVDEYNETYGTDFEVKDYEL